MHSNAQIDAQIGEMTQSVQRALAITGETSQALADAEIQGMIQSHIKNMVAENIHNAETQKTNLEEQSLVDLGEAVSILYFYYASKNT